MSAGGRKIEKNVPQFRTTSKQSLFEAAFEGIFECNARDGFPRIRNRYGKKIGPEQYEKAKEQITKYLGTK